MLDIKWIREHPETVQQIAKQKGVELSVAKLLRVEEQRRTHLKEAEELRSRRNRLSLEIGGLMKQGQGESKAKAETLKEEVRAANERLTAAESAWRDADAAYERLMLQVPNIVSPDTPVGRSDADNVEIRRVGDPPCFPFEPMDHVTLGELHGIIDIPRGVKVAGTRNYFLMGAGLALHRAVQQLALDRLIERGFTAMDVPLMVRGDALTHTGFFPLGRDQMFAVEGEDRWLAGTSEVSLVSYYSGEIVDVREPIRLAAVSNCFRSEVGSAGRDVRGLYRVHQFAKVEQVILCENDPAKSEALLQEITRNAEELLQLLELPYRVVAVCTGDMSQKTFKQYDIETWMPGKQGYGETHSSSNLHDFQARRAQIRYRDESGRLVYCHTLNNTAVASPRILIPLLENHQEEDGSIRIPPALRPYMGGMEKIVPNALSNNRPLET